MVDDTPTFRTTTEVEPDGSVSAASRLYLSDEEWTTRLECLRLAVTQFSPSDYQGAATNLDTYLDATEKVARRYASIVLDAARCRVKVWTCTDHASHWPVGCASVVVAADEREARTVLDAALATHALQGFAAEPYTLTEIDTSRANAVVLCDGDY